jgi:hypothetical protein
MIRTVKELDQFLTLRDKGVLVHVARERRKRRKGEVRTMLARAQEFVDAPSVHFVMVRGLHPVYLWGGGMSDEWRGYRLPTGQAVKVFWARHTGTTDDQETDLL